ncbi:MAG: hypothetical protein DMG60_22555 [Acidobacteria bacterium]|nr:MAG: hypothetical protein DMG60_22555 [Acidobacteriota bacterium]
MCKGCVLPQPFGFWAGIPMPSCLHSHVAVVGLAFLLTCGAAAQRGEGNGNVVGRIRVSKGTLPGERLLVSVQTRGQLVGNTYADSEGKFGFYDLAPNAYEITLTVEGYEPAMQIVRIDPLLSPTQFVELVLNPVSFREHRVPDRGLKGSNPYLVNSSDLLAKFPKAARKTFEEGVKCDREGRRDDAIKLYIRALEKAPGFYPARNNLGSDYLAKRQYSQAEEQFLEVLKQNSEDSEAYFNLGNVYLLTNRLGSSKAVLLQALSKDPGSALGHFLLGSVYGQMRRSGEAEQELHKAIEIEPTYAKAYLQLVNLYLTEKKTAEAREELRAFLSKFPQSPLAPKAKDVLKKLESTSN